MCTYFVDLLTSVTSARYKLKKLQSIIEFTTSLETMTEVTNTLETSQNYETIYDVTNSGIKGYIKDSF